MKKNLLYTVLACLLSSPCWPTLAHDKIVIELNQYALPVVKNLAVYQQMVKADPKKQMVNLQSAIPGIRLQMIYATDKHFVKKKLYTQPKAFLRKVAATALQKVQNDLAKKGLSLKIWDAYRPYSVTEQMWELVRDDRYVADPSHGSKHNRGCAVDLTIVNAKTGAELPMPTPYDNFTEKAHHSYMNLSKEVLANRALLKQTMEKNGFLSYDEEWWHYNYVEWGNYELMDIPFEQLETT